MQPELADAVHRLAAILLAVGDLRAERDEQVLAREAWEEAVEVATVAPGKVPRPDVEKIHAEASARLLGTV
jgi:hypothetical protein